MKVAQVTHEDDGKKVAIVLEAENEAEDVILGLLQYRNGVAGKVDIEDGDGHRLTLIMTVRSV